MNLSNVGFWVAVTWGTMFVLSAIWMVWEFTHPAHECDYCRRMTIRKVKGMWLCDYHYSNYHNSMNNMPIDSIVYEEENEHEKV